MYDFNDAEQTRNDFDLIPAKTVVDVALTVKTGSEEDGLTISENSGNSYLSCEYTVVGGPFDKRKFWQIYLMSGNEKAVNIARSALRSILESARGIDPDDMSDGAMAKRRINSYLDFDGMEFSVVVGIEKGNNGYSDKNKAVKYMPLSNDGSVPFDGGKPIAVPEQSKGTSEPIRKARQAIPDWAQ